jgi:uroporphyrinogen decarboxylase
MMNALALQPVDITPVWFMRQAGRALPEYREIRERRTLLDIGRNPELCARVTLQPVDRLGVDAAIIFADIMTPLIGIGVDIDIVDGVGPVVTSPIRSTQEVDRVRAIEPQADVPDILEAIAIVRSELDRSRRSSVPVLGFAGAPFTLASYLVEGRSSRDFINTKRLMYSEPDVWEKLMTRLSLMTAAYLRAQLESGAAAVQLFDSWAGVLSADDYRRYVLPYTAQTIELMSISGAPVINFSTGTGGFLESVAEAGGSTVGVDWRVPIDRAWSRIQSHQGIQGNLDPLTLLAPKAVMEREASAVLDRAACRPGHIFNLGHGVHPQTPVESLERLVEFVHEYRPVVADIRVQGTDVGAGVA